MPPRATKTTRTSRTKSSTSKKQPTLNLDKRLVLNQWLLSLFGVMTFEQLSDLLRDPAYEGYTEDNTTRFLGALSGLPSRHATLSVDDLKTYDENIVRHWQKIVEKRELASGTKMYMKYYQYLALLLTEIYLDRYFHDRDALRKTLNSYVSQFNRHKGQTDRVSDYEDDALRKLAYWQSTGSGKTLQMHVNILQYRHYLDRYGNLQQMNRIILLTPNEGLSRQHLAEFDRSKIEAELFRKDGGKLFTSQSVEIIDINKLRDDSGVKTVAVEAFEGNNLVLVDEGHRGSGGEEWMSKRRMLAEQGFSFEYSATFGQAMKAANDPALTEEYARCILFDYSYKYFYRDGYGKDYAIFNLDDDSQEDVRRKYLTGALLAFYQQLRLYRDQPDTFAPYLIAQPLMVFVGSSVTKSTSKRDVSDVVDILLFLAEVVSPDKRRRTIRDIEQLLTSQASLLDKGGREIFANTFSYLHEHQWTAEQVYEDLLRIVFGGLAPGSLHVENLKGVEGEVALRVGTNEPFGVINIGEPSALIKEIERANERAVRHGLTEPFAIHEPEFAGSLFRRIEETHSSVNMLIGSKKFTEGWNSWRVSSMGLMNIGRSEGSQIIQLFGRGVRLKGYDFALKRSRKVEEELRISAPKDIDCLETLNIFGVRAGYMAEFRNYLEDEGLPANTNRKPIILPTLRMFGPLPRLQAITVKNGIDFKKQGPRPILNRIPDGQRPNTILIDWYPKIESQRSTGARTNGDTINKHEGKLSRNHLALMDLDAVYFELLRFKHEKSWYNLNVTRDGIRTLLENPDWYTLRIPPDVLEFHAMEQVRVWQEIAVALLKKYCDTFYKFKKSEYEAPHLEYSDLDTDPDRNPNFVTSYHFLVEPSEKDLIEKLAQLTKDISRGTPSEPNVPTNNFRALCFKRHLYEPLIYLDSKHVSVTPVALNEGERDFVLDLKTFYDAHETFFADKELYLLRNQSRGKGIGFFEAGNFYPDFILWLLHEHKQHVLFIDPKGLRNLRGPEDSKIGFSTVIKDVERRLGNPDVFLYSFIVSFTPHRAVAHWKDGSGIMSINDFKAHNVYFQVDEKDSYIHEMFSKVI